MTPASLRSSLARRTPVVLVLSLFALAMPRSAAAQTGLLPACALTAGGCGVCDMVALLVNVSTFLLEVVSVLVVFAIIIGGLYWLLSFGNAERVDRGKQIITAAFIGLGFVLGGFAIVNIVLATLTNADPGEIVRPFGNTEWSEVCKEVDETANVGGGPGDTSTSCAVIQREGEACAEATCNDVNACVCVQGGTTNEWGCISRCAYTAKAELLTTSQALTASCVSTAEVCRTQVSGIFTGGTRGFGNPGPPGGSGKYTCTNQEVCCIVPASGLQGMVPEYNF